MPCQLLYDRGGGLPPRFADYASAIAASCVTTVPSVKVTLAVTPAAVSRTEPASSHFPRISPKKVSSEVFTRHAVKSALPSRTRACAPGRTVRDSLRIPVGLITRVRVRAREDWGLCITPESVVSLMPGFVFLLAMFGSFLGFS